MAIILPPLSFLFTFLIIRKAKIQGWRGSFLFSAVFWGFLLTLITEVLSLASKLDYYPVLGLWAAAALVLGLYLLIYRQKKVPMYPNLPHIYTSLSRFERYLILNIVFIIAAIGLIAWAAPPNTYDSMTYHLSRVSHWVQQKSVAFYPTHILRQLHQNPWSEFAILQFQILDGSDRFANFIQWFSMVGSILGVSLLAKELKASVRGQVLAGVVCATIPMGILQGSSTQTDYVVSFWLVCFTYFIFLLRENGKLVYALAAGAALGLGVLTKATAIIFAFPFLIWLVLSTIRRRSKNLAWLTAVILALAFLTNLGHFARNYDLYRNPLGPGSENEIFSYSNEIFSLPAVVSNLIRNTGLHLSTSFNQVNAVFEKGIALIHRFLQISPNDARTTWPGIDFQVPRLTFHEDTTGNFIHLLLITGSILLFLFQRSNNQDARPYVFSLLLGFLLFCVLLKWQLWHSRLHLPLFVLFAPFIGLVLSRPRAGRIQHLFAVLLMVTALPWIFNNSSRPLLGKNSVFTTSRTDQYFRNRPSIAGPYTESVEYISNLGCSDIGLIMGGDDWEYPFWVLLDEKSKEAFHIEHINVTNISKQKYGDGFLGTQRPCAILSLSADAPSTISLANSAYLKEQSFDSVSVYTPP